MLQVARGGQASTQERCTYSFSSFHFSIVICHGVACEGNNDK